MKNEEYTLTQDRLIVMADLIRHLDLVAFINQITATQKAAPILDPQIYTDLRDYEAIRQVAHAALDYKTKLESIRKNWRERRARAVLKGE